MRRKRSRNTKAVVCTGYERLRKRWQALIENSAAPSNSQSHQDATSVAHEQMADHRRLCAACQSEDIALEAGSLQSATTGIASLP